MREENDALLRTFHYFGPCEHCGRPTWLEGHHIFCRGMGGGSRLDVRLNIIALCRGWHNGVWVSCHDDAQQGRIARCDLLAKVAAREGLLQSQVLDELRRLLREPGDPGRRRPKKRRKKGRWSA